MKIRHITLFATACIMMMCGCKDDKPQYGAPMSLKVYGVTGRANLSPGLTMGLSVSEPVGANNVKLTVSSTGTIESDEVRWGFDQSSSSRFFVYSPFNESYTGKEEVTISVPADQSTAEKMIKANLLTAVASGGPADKSVNIKMNHAMTAMSVAFDNRSGEKITSVTVKRFQNQGKLNMITGELVASGGVANITPMRSPYDENVFSFIYVPQDVIPVFEVKLESGKVICFDFQDNSVHQYPGKIIRMSGLLITDKTPEDNLLPLSGVNMTQWTQNGIPEFPAPNPFLTLAELQNVVPDEYNDNIFSANLNMVTVTAVDRTDVNYLGLILEDKSKAVHVWAYPNSKLSEGNTIIGPIMGFMEKPSDDEYHISYFYTTEATIGKADKLPCTDGKFSELKENIGDWEYRRMQFRNVVIEEEFENDRAIFIQDTSRISVVCKGVGCTPAKGAKGNLIGFPVRLGSDIVIMVYDDSQFDSFVKNSIDNELTRSTAYGMYDVSDPDTAVYVIKGADKQMQHSVRYYSIGRSMQVTDLKSGESHLFFIYGQNGSMTVGREYTVAFNVQGKSLLKGTTMTMECIKVDDNTAWLVDKSGNNGLVFAL